MSTRNIVVFGQSGAGKSSVVNLMAGKDIAKTSMETWRCTMHWTEYSIAFDGYDFNAFDTIGMEDHQLGIDGYFCRRERVPFDHKATERGQHTSTAILRASR